MTKQITLSHSKRAAYGCPHHFYERYIARTPTGKSTNLAEGNFLHDIAKSYTSALMSAKVSSDNEILEDVFKNLWKKQSILPENYYDNIEGVVRLFGERFEIDLSTVWGAEVGIGFTRDLKYIEFPALGNYGAEDKWCEENNVWVHQRLDRVDIDSSGTVATITDYKSARAITGKSSLEAKGQGKQYAWALMQINEYLEKVYVVFDFIRFMNAKVTLEYSREDVEGVPRMLEIFSEKIEEKIKSGEWLAMQGDVCELCEYKCPLNDSSLEMPVVIQDSDIAVKLGQKAQALKREAKQIEDLLKIYTKQSPPVNIGKGEYGYQTSTSLGIKSAELVSMCLDGGHDIDKLLSVNSAAIERVMTKGEDGELIGKIEGLKVDEDGKLKGKATSRFGFKETKE